MSEEETDSQSGRHYFGTTRVQSSFAYSGPVFVILMVMMVTLVVVIVLGNALVILAFKVDKSLRRQCNYYFLNLAISDFLVGKSVFLVVFSLFLCQRHSHFKQIMFFLPYRHIYITDPG